MAGIYRCSGFLFWLIQILIKYNNPGIKYDPKIEHYFPTAKYVLFQRKRGNYLILTKSG